MFCKNCGNEINDNAVICPKCGCAVKSLSEYSDKKWGTAMLLCLFLGEFGIHRFYTGQTASAIVQLFTGGLFGIWWFFDLFTLSLGLYRVYGRKLQGFSILFGLFALVIWFLLIVAIIGMAKGA